jgi:hypothetical protein
MLPTDTSPHRTTGSCYTGGRRPVALARIPPLTTTALQISPACSHPSSPPRPCAPPPPAAAAPTATAGTPRCSDPCNTQDKPHQTPSRERIVLILSCRYPLPSLMWLSEHAPSPGRPDSYTTVGIRDSGTTSVYKTNHRLYQSRSDLASASPPREASRPKLDMMELKFSVLSAPVSEASVECSCGLRMIASSSSGVCRRTRSKSRQPDTAVSGITHKPPWADCPEGHLSTLASTDLPPFRPRVH